MTSSPLWPSVQYTLHCDEYVSLQFSGSTIVSFEIKILLGQLSSMQEGSPLLRVFEEKKVPD